MQIILNFKKKAIVREEVAGFFIFFLQPGKERAEREEISYKPVWSVSLPTKPACGQAIFKVKTGSSGICQSSCRMSRFSSKPLSNVFPSC